MDEVDVFSRHMSRGKLFLWSQVPTLSASVLLVVALWCSHAPALGSAWVTGGLTLIALGGVVAVLPPALRVWWWSAFPASLDFIAVALLRPDVLPVIPAVSFLAVFPALWMAYSFPRRMLVIPIMGELFVTAVTGLRLSGPMTRAADWANFLFSPAIVIIIVIVVYLAAARFERARVAAKNAAERLAVALAESEDRELVTRTVLSTTQAGIAFYDEFSRLGMANDNAAAMTEAVGFRLDVPPFAGLEARQADRKTLIPLDQQIIPRALRGDHVVDHMEWLGPAGRQVAILASSAQARRPDGSLLGTVVSAYDVTDLANALRLRDEFLTTVSHELRTPLTSILGYLDLVRDAGPELRGEFLDIIERNAEQLLALVQDLLTASQTSISVQRRLTNVAGIVNAAVESSRFLAETALVTLKADAVREVTAWVDEGRLGEVVENLLSNAIKFTRPGGSVEVRLKRGGENLVLQVADTGIGIELEDQKHVFDKFYRSHAVQEQAIPGTGIGLSIVKVVTAAHDGTLVLESSPGNGSTITITIPLRPRSNEDEVVPVGSANAVAAQGM